MLSNTRLGSLICAQIKVREDSPGK
jgi:hypothetical protein